VLYDAFTYFEAAAGSHTVVLGARLADSPGHYEARWAAG
jgi:hypothetical protein